MTRTILITGGTGKIGRVLVRHFLSAGDRVITTSRTAEGVAALETEFGGEAGCFFAVRVDLATGTGAGDLVARLNALGLRPDGLVNNARDVRHLAMQADGSVTRESFAGEFLMDVIVPYELTLALANQEDSRLKSVVNMGSMYGSVAANPSLYDDAARQSPLHYGVCKAAVAHLSRELAVRLADRGIRVNCIAFGGVEGRVDEAFKARYAALVPQRRMLREEEVAGPVDALLSDGFSAMTGHVLAVDGGWGIW